MQEKDKELSLLYDKLKYYRELIDKYKKNMIETKVDVVGYETVNELESKLKTLEKQQTSLENEVTSLRRI